MKRDRSVDGAPPPSPELSVVVPIFNEQEVLPELHRRLSAAAETWGRTFEVLYIDDGSVDESSRLLRELCAQSPGFGFLRLSRNFGHQAAISAGLDHARGAAVVVMDGDLQDPPELIAKLLARWDEGHEVVYAIREERKEHPLLRSAYALFYRLLAFSSEIEMPLDAGDFCLLDRRVVDTLNAFPERERFVRGLRAYAGFRQTGVSYHRQQRLVGSSKYTLRRLVRLALSGLIGFSLTPLRLPLYSGVGLALAAGIALPTLAWTVWVPAMAAGGTRAQIAWLQLGVVFLAALIGVTLAAIGVLGEYLGRVLTEVKRRPHYIVDSSASTVGTRLDEGAR